MNDHTAEKDGPRIRDNGPANPRPTTENDAGVCGCGHSLSEHDETGRCDALRRYPEVLYTRYCGCEKPWTTSVIPPGGDPS